MRNRDVKNLTIHNKTNQQWLLKPILDGEYWSGPDTISIDPQQGKNYEITYRPLTMTLENKKHTVGQHFGILLVGLHCFFDLLKSCNTLFKDSSLMVLTLIHEGTILLNDLQRKLVISWKGETYSFNI